MQKDMWYFLGALSIVAVSVFLGRHHFPGDYEKQMAVGVCAVAIYFGLYMAKNFLQTPKSWELPERLPDDPDAEARSQGLRILRDMCDKSYILDTHGSVWLYEEPAPDGMIYFHLTAHIDNECFESRTISVSEKNIRRIGTDRITLRERDHLWRNMREANDDLAEAVQKYRQAPLKAPLLKPVSPAADKTVYL